jgi:hypothetical protein
VLIAAPAVHPVGTLQTADGGRTQKKLHPVIGLLAMPLMVLHRGQGIFLYLPAAGSLSKCMPPMASHRGTVGGIVSPPTPPTISTIMMQDMLGDLNTERGAESNTWQESVSTTPRGAWSGP